MAKDKGQPTTGNGRNGSGKTPKGVVFKTADGGVKGGTPRPKSRLRVPKWLGGR